MTLRPPLILITGGGMRQPTHHYHQTHSHRPATAKRSTVKWTARFILVVGSGFSGKLK